MIFETGSRPGPGIVIFGTGSKRYDFWDQIHESNIIFETGSREVLFWGLDPRQGSMIFGIGSREV